MAHIEHFFIKLFEDVFGYDGFQAIDDPVLIFFRALVFSVALQELDPLVDVESVGHIDESEEVELVVDCMDGCVHM